jgi:hypothetical protein
MLGLNDFTPFTHIKCNDGFVMSVQAAATCYCYPRRDTGPWSEVEVGFPSEKENLLMEYAENPERPTDTVYLNVPVEVVQKIIANHGGTNEEGEKVMRTVTGT